MKALPLFLSCTWSGVTCYMLVFGKCLLISKVFCLFQSFCINPPLNSSIGSKLSFLLFLRSLKPVDQRADRAACKRVGKKVYEKKKRSRKYLQILTILDKNQKWPVNYPLAEKLVQISVTALKTMVVCQLRSWPSGQKENGLFLAKSLTSSLFSENFFPLPSVESFDF